MAIYTISDLHLPLGVDKPMNIFGNVWNDYVTRLKDNWKSVIKEDDLTVIGGDFSWATYLEQSVRDFEFLHSLPGKKILLKGNHDYWWTTKNKLREFAEKQNFDDIQFLHNNSFIYEDIAICGSRGWLLPQTFKKQQDIKIYDREVERLRLSINDAKNKGAKEIVVFLHFPPVLKDLKKNKMVKLLEEEGIKRCYYGHIHKNSVSNSFEGVFEGVEYKLCACDHLDFMPMRIN